LFLQTDDRAGLLKMTGSVAIAGAGIGGLAASLALLRKGWKVHIYEQSDAIRILGASIYIWENGLQVLETLGVFDRVIADAVHVRIRERRDAGGELFGIENTASSGRLYLPLRRALLTSLQDAVLEAGGEISFGMPAVGADPAGILKFADGSSVKADLVIGADGINSPVRDSLDMLQWRKPAGQYGYRIMIRREPGEADDDARSRICEHWNGTRRLLYAPSTREQVYVQLTSVRGDPAAGNPFDRASWIKTFPHLEWIMERIPADGKGDWFETVRLKSWTKGRVALIGDAASAQPPFLGQGGGIAMTSSLSLADALSKHDDVLAALVKWESDERRFVEWVQTVSRYYGQLARTPPAFRRAALKLFGGNEWLRERTIRCAAIRTPIGAKPLLA
jgi:2-polyprenyl-6-methoxyphenol hydroxylase-like FAD-dependent oxidoreductase